MYHWHMSHKNNMFLIGHPMIHDTCLTRPYFALTFPGGGGGRVYLDTPIPCTLVTCVIFYFANCTLDLGKFTKDSSRLEILHVTVL